MDVLLVKTSSMGDVVHTLPALTDAARALPDIRFHWVVEEAFTDLAARHPACVEVIPCALRRWRKSLWRSRGEWRAFKQRLRQGDYDLVIDAQGLLKTALVTRLPKAPKYGLDKHSAREPLSACVLDHPQPVARDQHAIWRVRQLFAQSLGYQLPAEAAASLPDYGLRQRDDNKPITAGSQLIFFHGTTWASKHYPEELWRRLLELALEKGCSVKLPWGNEAEKARAERLATGLDGVEVLPSLSLSQLLDLLLTLDGFVAVDTGLAHLAAAAGLAGVALYGPTDPSLTGVVGAHAKSLSASFSCAPCVRPECGYRGDEGKGVFPACFSRLPPEEVWRQLLAVSADV